MQFSAYSVYVCNIRAYLHQQRISHQSVLVRRLPVFPQEGKMDENQHNKSVANECTNFMINLSNSFMKSINMTSIPPSFQSYLHAHTVLGSWYHKLFFYKVVHSMTAWNKIYMSVLKNNSNYEATIIASSFLYDRFGRDVEYLPRFLLVGVPPLTHCEPHIGRSEYMWHVMKLSENIW